MVRFNYFHFGALRCRQVGRSPFHWATIYRNGRPESQYLCGSQAMHCQEASLDNVRGTVQVKCSTGATGRTKSDVDVNSRHRWQDISHALPDCLDGESCIESAFRLIRMASTAQCQKNRVIVVFSRKRRMSISRNIKFEHLMKHWHSRFPIASHCVIARTIVIAVRSRTQAHERRRAL